MCKFVKLKFSFQWKDSARLFNYFQQKKKSDILSETLQLYGKKLTFMKRDKILKNGLNLPDLALRVFKITDSIF